MDIFQNDDYLYISNFIEDKLQRLRQIEEFNARYLENTGLIEELFSKLNVEEKEKFDKVIKMNYELESYYFAYSFLLGAKYCKKIENL